MIFSMGEKNPSDRSRTLLKLTERGKNDRVKANETKRWRRKDGERRSKSKGIEERQQNEKEKQT